MGEALYINQTSKEHTTYAYEQSPFLCVGQRAVTKFHVPIVGLGKLGNVLIRLV